jgi:hypothetical protein
MTALAALIPAFCACLPAISPFSICMPYPVAINPTRIPMGNPSDAPEIRMTSIMALFALSLIRCGDPAANASRLKPGDYRKV